MCERDGALWYLTKYEGYDDIEEPSWQPADNLAGSEQKIAAFLAAPSERQPGCIYGHNRRVCRCHMPIYPIGHDEVIFKPFVYSNRQWVIGGVSGLRKKTEGAGDMLSGVQDEIRGFGFPMTADELAQVRRTAVAVVASCPESPAHVCVQVNSFRAKRNRLPLDSSPGAHTLFLSASVSVMYRKC